MQDLGATRDLFLLLTNSLCHLTNKQFKHRSSHLICTNDDMTLLSRPSELWLFMSPIKFVWSCHLTAYTRTSSTCVLPNHNARSVVAEPVLPAAIECFILASSGAWYGSLRTSLDQHYKVVLLWSKMLSPASTCTGTIRKYYEKLKDATSERKPWVQWIIPSLANLRWPTRPQPMGGHSLWLVVALILFFGRMDGRTPCVKIMTTYSTVAWWVNRCYK